jgi:hypothetical protein
MCPETAHRWSCDGEFFDDDHALAARLATRVDAGDDAASFTRDGCWFRLLWSDETGPVSPEDGGGRGRTYRVELVTNSPRCARGGVFESAWPEGYVHEGATARPGGTADDIVGILAGMGRVLWPDVYEA